MEKNVTLERIKQENLGIEYGEYFQDFLRAALKVAQANSRYVKYDVMDVYGNTKIEDVRYERIFAYELYHQFRKIMEDPSTEYSNENVVLSGEIHKGDKIYDMDQCSPDLVLHDPQGMFVKTQYFLCEMKLKTNPKLLDDLQKIKKMDLQGLNFQRYIFLLIGADRAFLKEEIRKALIKGIKEQLEKQKLPTKTFLKEEIREAIYTQLEELWLMSTVCVCLHDEK